MESSWIAIAVGFEVHRLRWAEERSPSSTGEPFWAVALLTGVDLLGFGPTVRKTWAQPFSESMLFFSFFLLRNLLVIAALENHCPTTILFPAVIAAACAGTITTMAWRRRMLPLRASARGQSAGDSTATLAMEATGLLP